MKAKLTTTEARNLAIRKSKNGRGIFTRRAFLLRETIFQVKGRFITGNVDDTLDEKTRSNAFRYDANRYISPAGSLGDFLNHSCEPNAAVVKKDAKLLVRATRRISASEEVTIDYSTILGADDIWQMNCSCRSAMCRRTVRQFYRLPKKLRDTYLKLGVVPRYIVATKRKS